MLKKKEYDEEFFFSDKMNQYELLNKTKRLIKNSNSFHKYMHNLKEENSSSYSNYSKLPSLNSIIMSNSIIYNQKKSLGHSSSTYSIKKVSPFNESMLINEKKEYIFHQLDMKVIR